MIYWGFAVGATVLALFGVVIGRIASPYGMVEADPLVKSNIVLFGTVVILAAWLALGLSGKTGMR